MTGLTRSLGLTVALLSLSVCTSATPLPDEVEDTFNAGVDLLDRGSDDEALAQFQRVLALDPGHESAYQLWRNTDQRIWTELMVMGGQYELVARRLMDLARSGRRELGRDEAAIRELIARAMGEDTIERRRAVDELTALHGEFAVPLMVRTLADKVADDERVLTMVALQGMSTRVVMPLIETLRSADPFLRRNVALVLGRIGDPRANGMLSWLAATDPDASVVQAAQEALAKTGGRGDALGNFLALGDAYAARDFDVVGPGMMSEVVWSWGEGGLSFTDVPGALYPDELAKANYYDAITADPSSEAALAGLAHCYVAQIAELRAQQRAGNDTAELMDQAQNGLLAIEIAGMGACEMALINALYSGDEAAAIGLCRVLGHSAPMAGSALRDALFDASASISAEAAVAIANIAIHSSSPVEPAVVEVLAETASREAVRLAAAVGPRSVKVAQALEAGGVMVHSFARGAQALGSIRRMPGVDVIVVADILPDLTAHQVITDVRSDERFAGVPIVMVAANPDEVADEWSDLVFAVAPADASDMESVLEALSGSLTGARAEADRLAMAATHVLQQLALGGLTDLSGAVPGLTATLDHRPDAVVVPALATLASAGSLAEAPAILAVLTDGERSEEARRAAAACLASILSRDNAVGADFLQALLDVLGSDAPLTVRGATARALGRLDLAPEIRAEILRQVRVDLGQ